MELPITRLLVAALGRTTREVEVLCPPARLGEADDAFARLQRSLPIQESSPLLRNPFVLAVLESRRAGAATPKWSWSEVLPIPSLWWKELGGDCSRSEALSVTTNGFLKGLVIHWSPKISMEIYDSGAGW